MANTKVTKAVLADDAVGLAQLHISNDPSNGQALTATSDGAGGYNLTWANNTVAGISSSADATAITIGSDESVDFAKGIVVEGSGTTAGVYLNGTNSDTATQGNFVRYGTNFATQSNAANNTLITKAFNGSIFVDALSVKSDGKVGVGTSSPSTPLDVVGSTGIRVNEDGSGTKVINIRSDFAGVDPAINVSTNHGLLFQTNNTERARIASDGAFGIANSNPHFDLDTNEARLGYYSAKGLGYNFFTTSINFSSGTSTKYIAISYGTGLFYNLDLDLHGQYGNFNAEGGIRKVYTGGVNATDSNIYGNGNSQLFSLGNTATYYSTGAAAKSGTTKIRIPITGTSLPAADTLHIGIRMFGIHLDRITSIAIE